MCWRIEGHDVDVVFEMLQELVELFLAAAAVCKDLHLVRNSLRHPRLDVVQVHVLLLREDARRERVKVEAGQRFRCDLFLRAS